MVLVILQWNSRRLLSNGQEFKKYILDLPHKPHIVCIQETWLKPQLDLVLNRYITLRNDRKIGNGGGVATFIQDGLTYSLVDKGKEQEYITIKICLGKDVVTVINFYNLI